MWITGRGASEPREAFPHGPGDFGTTNDMRSTSDKSITVTVNNDCAVKIRKIVFGLY